MEPQPARIRRHPSTLQDVADAAGVSLATASRVLNGSTRVVAEDYRDRVRAAAAALGYSANRVAQATARGTSASVALLVADIADPYFGRLASGVARGADETELIVTIATTDRDPAREAGLVRSLRGQRPTGLILGASRDRRDTTGRLLGEIEALSAVGARVVAIGTGSGAAGERVLLVDNRGGAAALAEALAELGYRRAVVIAAADGIATSDDRLAGFAAGFGAAGGMIDRVVRSGFAREDGVAAMRGLLDGGIAPGTLVFAISDVVAIGACSAIRAAGRAVGTDIAVAGFDDIATASDVTPQLTTVHLRLEDLGELALQACVAEAWAEDAGPLPARVVVRESTPRRPADPTA